MPLRHDPERRQYEVREGREFRFYGHGSAVHMKAARVTSPGSPRQLKTVFSLVPARLFSAEEAINLVAVMPPFKVTHEGNDSGGR